MMKLAPWNKVTRFVYVGRKKISKTSPRLLFLHLWGGLVWRNCTGDCACPVWLCHVYSTWCGNTWKYLGGTGWDFYDPPCYRFLGGTMTGTVRWPWKELSNADHCFIPWRWNEAWKPCPQQWGRAASLRSSVSLIERFDLDKGILAVW